MSCWPSAYGYKYTPIGLRQREKKDDHSGTRSICTTVHLPQGGHLLDIERQYGMDGSMSKRETQNMDPTAFSPPAIRAPERAPSPFNLEPFEPRPATDFERQADDIIANFRARQGMPLESQGREAVQYLEDTYGKYSSKLRRETSPSAVATTGQQKSLLSSRAALSSTKVSATAQQESSSMSSTSRVCGWCRTLWCSFTTLPPHQHPGGLAVADRVSSNRAVAPFCGHFWSLFRLSMYSVAYTVFYVHLVLDTYDWVYDSIFSYRILEQSYCMVFYYLDLSVSQKLLCRRSLFILVAVDSRNHHLLRRRVSI